MLPTDLHLQIIASWMVDRSQADQEFERLESHHYHFLLNLEGTCQAKCSFCDHTLTLEKYHLIPWGPGDRVEIRFPHKKKYIYIQFNLFKEELQPPINELFSFHDRKDPRLYIRNEQEILNEFLLLPDARGQGIYHKTLATVRLQKIISLLGQHFWRDFPKEDHRTSRNPNLFDTPLTSKDPKKEIETHRTFRAAMDYLFVNFKNASTENLSDYLNLSKPKVISLIKNNTGKLPKDLIDEIRFSVAVKEIRKEIEYLSENEPRMTNMEALEDIAKHIGVSKTKLNNMFKKEVKQTPLAFFQNSLKGSEVIT